MGNCTSINALQTSPNRPGSKNIQIRHAKTISGDIKNGAGRLEGREYKKKAERTSTRSPNQQNLHTVCIIQTITPTEKQFIKLLQDQKHSSLKKNQNTN
ncbi:hypothetical protein DMA11_16010 [Marinilabiliaceae bacterium JC017]|nr:hypothetical protein DMA11_16010 [Marinilabiliaceae bacterium JC017]